MAATLLFYNQDKLLEGPVFDSENQLLYFVSILDCLVYCYHPKTSQIISLKLPQPVGCVFVQGKYQVIAAVKNALYLCDFKKMSISHIKSFDFLEGVRFNDGIKTANGDLLLGTMGYPEVKPGLGKLYRYNGKTLSVLVENTTISNGLAFSHDGSFLYFIDTPTRSVMRFSYGQQLTNPIKVINFKSNGLPDGMFIDNNQKLWIAEWEGGCISQWCPLSGKKLNEIIIPTTLVSSVCSDDMGNFYVTTASNEKEKKIISGGLYFISSNYINQITKSRNQMDGEN